MSSQRPSRRYGFVKPSLVRLFSTVDGVGRAVKSLLPRPSNWRAPKRILLVNLAHIGDVLLTTPAIAAIRVRYPDAHIGMLVSPWSKPVVANNPRLDEVMVYRPSWWDRSRGSPYLVLPEFVTLVRMVRSGRFDWVVNFKSFFQENCAFALSGATRRVGYGLYGGGFLQTDEVPYAWDKHTVLQHLSLAEAVQASAPDPQLELTIPPDDERVVDEWIKSAPGNLSGRLAAMHVGAGYPSKLWPVERYIQVANKLHEKHGVTIALVGGPDDMPLIEQMKRGLSAPYLVSAGRFSLTQTAALLKRCLVFVGNDSGPAHLAAAVGTASVVIFSGENDIALWKPWGKRVITLQYKPSCYLCGLRVCNRDHACMTQISVDEVVVAAEQAQV